MCSVIGPSGCNVQRWNFFGTDGVREKWYPSCVSHRCMPHLFLCPDEWLDETMASDEIVCRTWVKLSKIAFNYDASIIQ